jgi:hypothetical protein
MQFGNFSKREVRKPQTALDEYRSQAHPTVKLRSEAHPDNSRMAEELQREAALPEKMRVTTTRPRGRLKAYHEY